MSVFQYHSEDGGGSRKRSRSQSNGYARAQPQAGPSKQRTMIEYEDEEEDYDIQAALDVEQAENGNDNGWEPHDHLYDEQEEDAFPVFQRASSSKATSTKATTSKSKRNGKEREVVRIYNEDEDDDDDVDMIPVPIDGEGAIISDTRIEQLTNEIRSIDEQIASLREARELLAQDKQVLLNQQRTAQATLREKQRHVSSTKQAPEAPQDGTVDYSDSSRFKWKKKLDGILDRVFGIKKLRLCQEGVLNAVLDNRDVICIMPTGGGKSVCFQAPALLSRGVTLVISPLLSLMADQVLALNSKGVEAVMITGSTPQNEIKEIMQNLTSGDGNIKLCYVTPEKIARSKTFANTLGKMYAAGLLARIAIDESHCCSQMGHDFRPDYKQLSMLRQLYPKTPIIALTATCGKAVLNDVVRILHLKACTSGESAEPRKTIFFSAPLYRPNLHYSVRIKPVGVPALAGEMADEILLRYPNSAGIIYCLSQKETETFAQAIREHSEGKIKIGTYHAGMSDYDKENIHKRWREGRIKCVVATIAFGMGIDAPDVRYVFHQTISKSMEGYYQETGRAGRDGKDSDCTLWFRPADASRLSTLTLSEVEGRKKLHNMLKYALDLKSCRKLLFDSYFGNPANVVAPFAESDRTLCGHCDNCIRNKVGSGTGTGTTTGTTASSKGKSKQAHDDEDDDEDEDVEQEQEQVSSATLDYTRKQQVINRDVTLEAWKACKIIRAADNLSSRITLPGAGDLCRGLNKSQFPIYNNSNSKTKNNSTADASKASLDLDKVCNGKITTLNKDEMELLLLHLIILGYLKEEFVQTAYTTNSYVVSGPSSARLVRFTEEDVMAQDAVKIELDTLGTVKAAKGKKGKKDLDEEDDEEADTEGGDKKKTKPAPRKRKSTKTAEIETASDAPEGSTSTKAKAKKKPASKDSATIAAKKTKAPPQTKKKDNSKEPSEEPLKKRRKKKADSDSEDDFEDIGLGRPPVKPSRTAQSATASKTAEQEEMDELDAGMDSDAPEVNGSGVPVEDDAEMSEETGEDGFLVDRFNKKARNGSVRNRAAEAALRRAGGGGGTTASTSANTRTQDSQIIDLDSD